MANNLLVSEIAHRSIVQQWGAGAPDIIWNDDLMGISIGPASEIHEVRVLSPSFPDPGIIVSALNPLLMVLKGPVRVTPAFAIPDLGAPGPPPIADVIFWRSTPARVPMRSTYRKTILSPTLAGGLGGGGTYLFNTYGRRRIRVGFDNGNPGSVSITVQMSPAMVYQNAGGAGVFAAGNNPGIQVTVPNGNVDVREVAAAGMVPWPVNSADAIAVNISANGARAIVVEAED